MHTVDLVRTSQQKLQNISVLRASLEHSAVVVTALGCIPPHVQRDFLLVTALEVPVPHAPLGLQPPALAVELYPTVSASEMALGSMAFV